MDLQFDTLVPKLDALLSRGLSRGVGDRNGQMCIEAAICTVLGLPHGDDPGCVADSVRTYKIILNDAEWSSSQSRAQGLRDLGIAQLGSKGVVDDVDFSQRMTEQTIRVLVPRLFRALPNVTENMKTAADRCEREGTLEAADAAVRAARAAVRAADAAVRAAEAAVRAAEAARAAWAADAAAGAEAKDDTYLRLSADLALQILTDLKSPGALWLQEQRGR